MVVDSSILLRCTTVQQAVDEISVCLQKHPLYYGHGLESPLDEAAYLVSFVAGLPPDFSVQAGKISVSKEQRCRMQEILEQRILLRKPLAYLLGQTWLAGQKFYVNEHVLIPRSPMAELLDAHLTPWWSCDQDPEWILDLCTGSGCLGILAAKQFQKAHVDISDIDEEAINVAARNVSLHNLEERVTPYISDIFSQLPKRQYDIILANPPYVSVCEQPDLPSEYRHEPAHALFAGEDGLEIAEQILLNASEFLSHQGILVMEVGQSAPALQQQFLHHNFIWLELERGGEGVCVLTYADCRRIAKQRIS